MTTVAFRGAPDPATDDRVAQLDALYRVECAGMLHRRVRDLTTQVVVDTIRIEP